MVTTWSFCGKGQDTFLQKDVEPRSLLCKNNQVESIVTSSQRHRIIYDEKLFGPSIFGKKINQQSCLKRSPFSDNLLRDSSNIAIQCLASRKMSLLNYSHTLLPKDQTPLVLPILIISKSNHKDLRVVIPERKVAEKDKPYLIDKDDSPSSR